MKEEFVHKDPFGENSPIDPEQLLRERNWDQLTDAERSEMQKLGSGKEEYERMYSLVHQLRAVTGVHDEDLVPSAGLRENLLLAFEEEQDKRRAMWWSGWWHRIGGALRFDIPAVRIGFAVVLLIVGVLTVFNLIGTDDSAPVIVNKENVHPSPEAPKENGATNNNITAQPGQKENQNPSAPQNVIEPNDDNLVVPAPTSNGAQVVDANAPVIVDTNANLFVVIQPDTALRLVNPLSFNATGAATCCATSNGTTLISNGGTNYSWNATGAVTFSNGTDVIGVNGLPPRARALSNDEQVLDVFFAVK